MNVFPDFPSRLNWSPHDLADAMPRRLFELYDFDAGDEANAANAARCDRRPPREWYGRYQPTPPLPMLFRVHS